MSAAKSVRAATLRVDASSYPYVTIDGESFERALDVGSLRDLPAKHGNRILVATWAGEHIAYAVGVAS